jgi:hypothetical protein
MRSSFKELHDAYKQHNLLLTVAVGAGEGTALNGYQIDKISEYFFFEINIIN